MSKGLISNMELISKVKAFIRRYRVYDSGSANCTNKDESIETDGLKLFTNRNKVEFNDNEIKLSGKEYEILKLLMKNPDRIYTIAMMQRMNGSMNFKREHGKFWVKLEFPIVK